MTCSRNCVNPVEAARFLCLIKFRKKEKQMYNKGDTVLYGELGEVLDIPKDQVLDYLIKKIDNKE